MHPNALSALWRCLVLTLLSLPWVATASVTPERIEWQNVPIDVTLQTGPERRVQFPVAIKVGLPTGITTKLRAQVLNDTLYLTANAPFESTRLVVQTRESSRTYLLDVTASDDKTLQPPLVIVDGASTASAAPTQSMSPPPAATAMDAAALTRFAAQQLYAPTRLLESHPGVVREPVDSTSVALFHDVPGTAQPLVAWRGGGLHVTAVKLTNTGTAPRILDPRTLSGAWLTATFQHHRLFAKGDEADTTVVYLVSSFPFAAALAAP